MTINNAEKLVCMGVEFPDCKEVRALLSNDVNRELWFFRENFRAPGYNGPGSFYHAKNAADLLWRRKGNVKFVWHPDLEIALEEYCTDESRSEIVLTGPASDGKSFGAGLYALLFWLSDPDNSGVLMCSTTLPGLKKRIWGDMRNLYISARDLIGVGNLVDSKTCIQSSKGDDKRGIFGIAVADGNEAKAMDRIIGFHPPRLLILADELTGIPWTIVDATTNLSTGKRKFQFIGMGNAASIFDSHGKMCEPKDGWGAVSVESEQWETKRGGTCLHFDVLKGENYRQGKIIYPFLATKEDVERTARNDGENSPQMWRMRRGYWCPEGAVSSVLSEALIKNSLSMTLTQWEGMPVKYAGLDPAIDGDRCILRFADVGLDVRGVETLQFGEVLTLKVDNLLVLKRPAEYQIADQVKKECEARGVAVDRFGMDTTGLGAGLAAIISEEWMPGFRKVQFSERPSDLPINATDSTTCHEAYRDKVTELWFSFRVVTLAGQIRGLDPESAIEFCSRLYENAAKIWVESKRDMKKRLSGKSPDCADAAVVLLDVVRHKGGLGALPSKARDIAQQQWRRMAREFEMSEEDAYTTDSMEAVA